MNPNLSQLIQPPKFCHLHLPDPNQGLTLGLSLSLSQPRVAPVLRSAPCLTGHVYDLIPPSWAVSSMLITVMVKEHPKCMNHEIFPPVLLEGSGYPCQQWQKVVSQWDFKNPHFKAKLSAMQSSRHHLFCLSTYEQPFSLSLFQLSRPFLSPSALILLFFSSFSLPQQPLTVWTDSPSTSRCSICESRNYILDCCFLPADTLPLGKGMV